MRHHDQAAVLFALLAAAVPAQTFVVDANNGPGTNFTTIGAAIAAVPDGAVLRVRAGHYVESSLVIRGKSLAILGDGGVDIEVPALPHPTIELLGPQQSVVLRRLAFRSATPGLTVELRCQLNQGQVRLDSIHGANGTAPLTLVSLRCDWLLVEDCEFGPDPVEITDSRSVFERCMLQGYPVGCVQVGGSAQWVDSTVRGGLWNGQPGSGFYVQATDVRLLGNTVVEGALAPATGTRGVCFRGGGTLRLEPSVTLIGALPWIPQTVQAVNAPMPRVTTGDAALGGAVAAALHGPIGHLGILAVGLPGPAIAVPGAADPTFWQSAPLSLQAIGVPTATQPLASATALPNDPAFLGLQLVWHGVSWAAGTGLQISNPSAYAAHLP